MISNSPYVLVLDCDMYCNDPTSARQAMCFHLDPKISPSLGFVQFPQKFYNISRTDIYDSQLRSIFKILWQGMDGLEGPCVSGTGFYIKREALYANPIKDGDIMELRRYFGPSNEFIKSLGWHYKHSDHQHFSSLMKETQFLASCAYENQTKWGKEVSNWFFMVFSFIFLSSLSKHLQEVLSTGGSMMSWINEQRMWMIKSVTCHLYGSLDAIMKRLGMKEASFLPTNKVINDEQIRLYQMGKFDFQTSSTLLSPLVILTIVNFISFIGGVTRAMITQKFSEMFMQVFLSFFIVTMGYPVIEGMILRKDKGRIPPSVIALSLFISTIFLSLGSVIVMYL